MKNCNFFNISNGQWASSGVRNDYNWFAMTNYFDAKLFNLNEYAKTCNSQITKNSSNIGGFWNILKAQLDNDPSLTNHSDICVMNTEEIYHSNTQLEMNERIREYFGFHKNIVGIQNNKIGIDYGVIKNKIIVIPFVYLEPQSLDFLDYFVPKVIRDCEARSIFVIFACCIADDQNGKFPTEEEFPNISQNSFGIEISFDTFRGIMDMMNNSKPKETFSRKAKPIDLSGTSWRSKDGKHNISFDQYSENGANYNGYFTIYHYDSTNNTLFLQIDLDGLCQEFCLNVISLSSTEMVVDGKWGKVVLLKK